MTDNNNNNIQPLQLPINSLQLAKWDVRRNGENVEEFESFKNSIQQNGLIYPLTVARMSNTGEIIVVAGRRRLRALKELDWKSVPVIIQFQDVTETELRRISLIENLHRKELVDIEKGFGIVAVYEAAGYTGEQAIIGAKSIDNYFGNGKGKTWDDLSTEDCSVLRNNGKTGFNANELRYDPKFIEVCKSIGHSPKFQYQLMQIVLQIDPDVLIEAQKAELPTYKKLLLTKSRLKQHPSIQKNLIPKLKKLSPKQGEVLVNQKLRDIEEGYIIPASPDSKEFVYSEKPAHEREIVKKGDTNKILDLPAAIELDIIAQSNKLIKLLTGRAFTKGEYGYTTKVVDNNKERMFKIIKSLDRDTNMIGALIESMEILEYTLGIMKDLLMKEREVAKEQQEMIKR